MMRAEEGWALAAASRGLFIGGQRVLTDASYPVINPATESVITQAPEATAAHVQQAVAAAKAAQSLWAEESPTARATILREIGRVLESRRAELAPLIAAETGCLLSAAPTIVDRSVARFAKFAELSTALQPIDHPIETRDTPAGRSLSFGRTARRPVGVVAAIAPFNFPLIGAASKIAPAIAMGNTVVFKPAPQDPLEILAFASICQEAGVPDGVVNIVTGSGVDVGRALIASEDVDMVSFTGSTGAGTEIYRGGADSMRRMLLELGGKGALIVREDADLDAATEALGRVWTYYSGQWCAAPTRAIVHRKVHDELVDRLVRLGRSLQVGDPCDSTTNVGPVISQTQRQKIEGSVAAAVANGAVEALSAPPRGGRDRGYFVSPALLLGCRPDMPIVQEEIFGPVLSVLTFDTDDEAIELANGTRFGLTNYLFSADVARAWELAARLRSGTVLVNTATPRDDLPFGGVGMSGVGRDNGIFALESYSEAQGILVASGAGTPG